MFRMSMCFFFFSSRRRHTRFDCDWSSDVCSSDVFGTISRLSAAAASQEGGPGNTTVAGHVHHLTSSLALATLGLGGQPTSRDRSRSWTVSRVDEAGWADLQARLRREYESLLVAVETHAVWDEDALGVAIGAIAHAADHLGAIRPRPAPRGAEALPWPGQPG